MRPIDPIPALKRQLGAEIVRLTAHWSAHEAASLLMTDQPRVSDLRNGKLDRFSLETLIRMTARLLQNVTIEVTPIPIQRRIRLRGRQARSSP